jgi:hypothetical protein
MLFMNNHDLFLALEGAQMYPLFHTLLVEPDAQRAQVLVSMFTALGAVVTHAPGAARAGGLLSHLLPDLLVVGVYPASIRSLHPWLPSLLAATPLRTLLYAEQGALLDTVALTLPRLVTTVLWPYSCGELSFLLAPLLAEPSAERPRLAIPKQTPSQRADPLSAEYSPRLAL